MKKTAALLLSLALILSLAACETGPAGGSKSPDASPSGSAEEPTTPIYVNEYTQALAGVDADTVMFTVDGLDVTAEFYFYWLYHDCYTMDQNYRQYLGTPLDFDETSDDGTTAAQYLKEDARKFAAVYAVLEREAQAAGAGATEEQKAQWEAQKAAYIAQEGRDTFDDLLRRQGLSEESFDRLSLMSTVLVTNAAEKLVPDPTEEEAEQFRTDNSVYGAKHILIRTVVQNEDGTVSFARGGTPKGAGGGDYTGTAEEYNAAALEKINGILDQLKAADDPAARFDELMVQYSEDPGLAAYPDGYTFGPGEMVEAFEEGTKALAYGAYSPEPVQSGDGYHIILRTVPDVTELYRGAKMNELMNGWAELEYVTTPAYDRLDVKDFYEKGTAYAARFDETPAPSGSPSGGDGN